MSQVAICKCKDLETTQTLMDRVKTIGDSIRKRAFSLFQHRNGGTGSDWNDWLQAERDLVLMPATELLEDEKQFTASLALPGFEAKEIEVSAMPDALVIQAGGHHTHEGTSGSVRFCEFSDKQLFRRLDLSCPVDVDKVTASIDKGILRIVAPKAAGQITAAA